MFKKWLMKLITSFWSALYGEWTKEQKEKLYNDLADVTELEQYLRNNGFEWKSDGLNWNVKVDTFERPERVLARRWGNCGDYMRLFEDFLKFKGKGRYTQYELRAGYLWHYVSVINGSLFQSNAKLLPMQGDEGATLLYYFPQYIEVHILDEWSAE